LDNNLIYYLNDRILTKDTILEKGDNYIRFPSRLIGGMSEDYINSEDEALDNDKYDDKNGLLQPALLRP
jgi:hypothetical protein